MAGLAASRPRRPLCSFLFKPAVPLFPSSNITLTSPQHHHGLTNGYLRRRGEEEDRLSRSSSGVEGESLQVRFEAAPTTPSSFSTDIDSNRYAFTKQVFLGCARASQIVQRRNAGLLLACRTTYLEAVDLYYARTTFKYCSLRHLQPFLQAIHAEHRNAIPEILRVQSDDTDARAKRDILVGEVVSLEEHGLQLKHVMKTHLRVGGEDVWMLASSEHLESVRSSRKYHKARLGR